MSYIEKEVKVLDVTVQELTKRLQHLDATEIYNGERIITHFDYGDRKLTKEGRFIKITEEGKLKVSYDSKLETGEKESIKFTASRKEEVMEFLKRLELYPIAECRSHRISFEWEGIDFDIDAFPQIPAFLEIDREGSGVTLEEILHKLNLLNSQVVTLSTPEIYTYYGLNYFDIFKM